MEDILWASWDDDFIAFHRPSGKTHLLNAASEALLNGMLTRPKPTEDIVRELIAEEGVDIDAELVAAIDSLLIRLEELGLVSRT